MRTCLLLPLLLLLVAAALARPAHHDVPSEGDSAARLDPHSPELHEKAQPEVDGVLIRERRSPKRNKDRGSFSTVVQHQPGGGTVVQAQGQGNLWTSRNGRTNVFAQGELSQVLGGPGRGRPTGGVSIGFTHKF